MPPRKIMIAGERFNRWTVLRPYGMLGKYHTVWCRCDCGTEQEVRESHLRAGASKSCGCSNRAPLTHGMAGRLDDKGARVPEYRTWGHIIQRCTNPNHPGFRGYGARGITVCDRWRESFAAFYEDMGPRPSSKHSIDRIDNDGGYEPGNCRWATKKTQSRNTSTNRLLTFRGRTQSLAAWAEETGISQFTLSTRVNTLGWSVERALTEPVRGHARPS